MSTAVLQGADGAPEDALQKSEGVWHAAWRRFRADRVGLVSLVIVAGFILLIVLAALGLVAGNWQAEVGVPNAPPTFMGPAAPQSAGAIESPKGPNVDLSDIDPLAPRYKEWDERAKQFQTLETVKAQTLPFGGDRLGRDVLSKAVKGTEISVFGRAHHDTRQNQPHRHHPPSEQPVQAVHPPQHRIGDDALSCADGHDIPDQPSHFHKPQGRRNGQRAGCHRYHCKRKR